MPPNTPNSHGVTKTFTPDETASWFAGLDKRFASAEVWCEDPDGRLLIVKSPYKRHWSVPGGIVDTGETPKQAAVRETMEEVGIALKPENLEFRMAVDRVLGRLGQSYQFVFRADITKQQIDSIELQPDEITEYVPIARDEVLQNNNESDRIFGATIYDWANGVNGYSEKVFPPPSDTENV